MQLNYRGISYQSESAVESILGEVSGKYRGISMKMGHVASHIDPSSVALRYRGVSYRNNH
jgi:hypothetical protein